LKNVKLPCVFFKDIRARGENRMAKNVYLNVYLIACLFIYSLLGRIEPIEGTSKMPNYLYDLDQVRYELYQTNEGMNYNWLFFPGGAGLDSSYLRSLVDELNLPGNIWLIDLPGNGGNIQDSFSENYDRWIEIYSRIFGQFDNPILVGHSFGGMFPLLFSELETHLKGFIILNSAP
jgi:pimeloyl-ACP methyl ester carboxylesterase